MDKFTERFYSAPAESFFIFGPKGTGKSTWLKETFPDAYLVDLLDDRTFRNHIAHPERIKQFERDLRQLQDEDVYLWPEHNLLVWKGGCLLRDFQSGRWQIF